MAADEQAAVVSGADIGEGLRRRNVPGQTGVVQNQHEVDDKKKLAKQVWDSAKLTLQPLKPSADADYSHSHL